MNSLIARNSLFDEFFKDVAPGFFVKPLHGEPLPQAIRVDIQETPTAFAVQAEIPGVSKDDIHIHIDGSVVSLRAEVKQMDRQTDNERVLRTERFYGAVSRTFQLPVDIDQALAKARYENGVLQLTLPKKLASTSQRLAVE